MRQTVARRSAVFKSGIAALMLLFTQTGPDLGRIVTDEIVATEVVRTMVGSIGLMASVPPTRPRAGSRRDVSAVITLLGTEPSL